MEQPIQKNISVGKVIPSELSFFQKLTLLLEKLTLITNSILHTVSSILLFALMFLTAADVIGRYFFNSPITGTYELTGLALALMIFFSLGSGQIFKDHIEIDFLTSKMPNKVQELLRGAASLILFILMSLTTWQLFEYTKRTWQGNELSGDLGLPLYIFIGLTVIGAISFTLTFLLDAFQSFIKAVNKHES
ncbi:MULTISPECIES: TRAP transporter small permease [Cytobacillus]|uniref:TRAP transporter small permease n=1 Tax=Cytobacillus TaxID=2675230 RepID=UPI00203EE1DC|nr:TRAP transporter small permease [Cytobacillus firmus]MCM3706607.1 TRAP transporter small permease [Cytobacillus firmus]